MPLISKFGSLSSQTGSGSYSTGPARFVAVSSDATTVGLSSDGITWTTSALPSPKSWRDVSYGQNKFVVVGQASNLADMKTCAVSTDNGNTWTEYNMSQTLPYPWLAVAYGADKWVAVGGSGTLFNYSSDAITWSQAFMPADTVWNGIAFGSGTFVALGLTDRVATSTDGVNWTLRSLPDSRDWRDVAYGAGVFVAVAADTDQAAYSLDLGATWANCTMPQIDAWNTVAYGDNTWVAVSGDYDGRVNAATSPDGITWTSSLLPNAAWEDMAYGQGRFVVVEGFVLANSNIGAITFDQASTWSNVTLPSADWTAITYGGT